MIKLVLWLKKIMGKKTIRYLRALTLFRIPHICRRIQISLFLLCICCLPPLVFTFLSLFLSWKKNKQQICIIPVEQFVFFISDWQIKTPILGVQHTSVETLFSSGTQMTLQGRRTLRKHTDHRSKSAKAKYRTKEARKDDLEEITHLYI